MAKIIEVSVITLLILFLSAEGVKIGGTCTDTSNCTEVANSDCTGSKTKTCTCKAKFVAKDDNTKCLATVNTTCTANDDCLPNANCTASKCMCKMNYTPSKDGKECNGATVLTASVVVMVAAILMSLTRFTDSLGPQP